MSSDTNVLCGFDDAYAPHFATMISSLFTASPNRQRIKINLISNLLSPRVRAQLDRIVALYGVGEIQWLEVDCSPFLDAPLTMHFTLAAYMKIAAFNVVRAERVLYLDVDLLCLADVAELHDSNLEGNTLGAILDPASTFGVDQHNYDLGIAAGALCFNSGVMVVDTAQWRKERMTETSIDYLQRKKWAIWWVDQDVLNGVLVGKWLKLPSVWNAQAHFWKPVFRNCMAAKMPGELDVIRSPKIVHFNDPAKPWHFGYRHPYREVYLQHLSRSGWPHSTQVASWKGIRDLVVSFEHEIGTEQKT